MFVQGQILIRSIFVKIRKLCSHVQQHSSNKLLKLLTYLKSLWVLYFQAQSSSDISENRTRCSPTKETSVSETGRNIIYTLRKQDKTW